MKKSKPDSMKFFQKEISSGAYILLTKDYGKAMDSKNIIQNALNLNPAERLLIIEALSKSLSEPNTDIEKYWKEEVEQRYKAYIDGKIKSISHDEILKKWK